MRVEGRGPAKYRQRLSVAALPIRDSKRNYHGVSRETANNLIEYNHPRPDRPHKTTAEIFPAAAQQRQITIVTLDGNRPDIGAVALWR